jgi:hypothetical protein
MFSLEYFPKRYLNIVLYPSYVAKQWVLAGLYTLCDFLLFLFFHLMYCIVRYLYDNDCDDFDAVQSTMFVCNVRSFWVYFFVWFANVSFDHYKMTGGM